MTILFTYASVLPIRSVVPVHFPEDQNVAIQIFWQLALLNLSLIQDQCIVSVHLLCWISAFKYFTEIQTNKVGLVTEIQISSKHLIHSTNEKRSAYSNISVTLIAMTGQFWTSHLNPAIYDICWGLRENTRSRCWICAV